MRHLSSSWLNSYFSTEISFNKLYGKRIVNRWNVSESFKLMWGSRIWAPKEWGGDPRLWRRISLSSTSPARPYHLNFILGELLSFDIPLVRRVAF